MKNMIRKKGRMVLTQIFSGRQMLKNMGLLIRAQIHGD